MTNVSNELDYSFSISSSRPKVLCEFKVENVRRGWVDLNLSPLPIYKETYEPIFGDKKIKRKRYAKKTGAWLVGGFDPYDKSIHPFKMRGLQAASWDSAKLLARQLMREYWDAWWLYSLRTLWLKRHFVAKNKSTHEWRRLYTHLPAICPKQYWQFSVYRSASPTLYKHYLDFFSVRWLAGCISYVPDLYPNFDDVSPFDPENIEKYKWPWEHMGPDIACLITTVGDRLALLEYGESKGWDYWEFSDFVVNWVQCYNDDVGKKVYAYRAGDFRDPPLIANLWLKTSSYASWRFILPSDTFGPDPDWLDKVPDDMKRHYSYFRKGMKTRRGLSGYEPKAGHLTPSESFAKMQA